MDSAATIALATALEMEMEQFRRELAAVAQSPSQEAVEDYVERIPVLLAVAAGGVFAASALESAMAKAYADGVRMAGIGPVAETAMNAPRAFSAVDISGLLAHSPNPVSAAKKAIATRADAVAKVVKGQVAQDLRDKLEKAGELEGEELKELLDEAVESLEDLSDNPHVQLHAETQEAQAKGYGMFSAQQTDAYLNAVPFQELYRAESRHEWRDWPRRWSAQGGNFYEGPSDYPEGRMIAPTNSAIWADISAFGDPYYPYDYNSGMATKPVTLEEAKRLGLHGAHHKAKPVKLDFNARINFSINFDDDIKSALLDSLGSWSEKKGEAVPT